MTALPKLAAPARRALQAAAIDTLEQLTGYTEAQLLSLHGMGPNAITQLKNALNKQGLTLLEAKPRR